MITAADVVGKFAVRDTTGWHRVHGVHDGVVDCVSWRAEDDHIRVGDVLEVLP